MVTGLTNGTTYTFTVTATNVRGTGQPSMPSNAVVPNVPSDVLRYVEVDHLDTPRQLSNGSGTVVWRWDSTDAFGANAPNEDPDGDGINTVFNLRMPGQYADKETNTFYNYFRDYDPTVGRYLTSDPIGLAGGMNTYAYVGGNPLSYVDPLGLAGAPPLFDPKNDSINNRPGPTDQTGRSGRTGATIERGPDRPLIKDKIRDRVFDKTIEKIIGIPAVASKSPVGMFIWGITYSPEVGGCNGGYCTDTIPQTPNVCPAP